MFCISLGDSVRHPYLPLRRGRHTPHPAGSRPNGGRGLSHAEGQMEVYIGLVIKRLNRGVYIDLFALILRGLYRPYNLVFLEVYKDIIIL